MFSGSGFLTTLLGLELDIHNKIEISEELDLDISLGTLFPGNSFNAVYELNNNTTSGFDPSIKAEFTLKYVY